MIPIDPIKPVTRAPKPYELKEYEGDLVVQRKFNGARATTTSNENGHQLWSRSLSVSGNRVSYTLQMPHIIQELTDWGIPKGTVFDGELVSFRSGDTEHFYDVNSATNGHVTNCLAHQKEHGNLTYVIFDIVYFRTQPLYNLPLRTRLDLLQKLFSVCPNMKWVRLADIEPFTKTVDEYREDATARGWEGYVVKNLESTYDYKGKFGEARRPKSTWWKIKPERFADVIVVDFEYGKGESTVDVAGTLICMQHDVNGDLVQVCRVGTGFSATERKTLSTMDFRTNPRVGLVQYSHRHENGKLIHPVWCGFREDKAPVECIMEEE